MFKERQFSVNANHLGKRKGEIQKVTEEDILQLAQSMHTLIKETKVRHLLLRNSFTSDDDIFSFGGGSGTSSAKNSLSACCNRLVLRIGTVGFFNDFPSSTFFSTTIDGAGVSVGTFVVFDVDSIWGTVFSFIDLSADADRFVGAVIARTANVGFNCGLLIGRS